MEVYIIKITKVSILLKIVRLLTNLNLNNYMEQMNTGLGKSDINSVESFTSTATEQLAASQAQLEMVLATNKDDIQTITNLENRIKELEPLAAAEKEVEELETAA